jgi:uncharacterized damage-inducible protein DinB
MLINALISIFERDLNKLIVEIELYKYEDHLWLVDKNIANSAGNLALHLVGNINTYIGKEIGKTNYVRDRDLEFCQKNVPREDLIQKITDTIKVVKDALVNVKIEDLEKEYPIVVFKEKMTTGYFLIHLATHLTYHLGQINYHRRLLD